MDPSHLTIDWSQQVTVTTDASKVGFVVLLALIGLHDVWYTIRECMVSLRNRFFPP